MAERGRGPTRRTFEVEDEPVVYGLTRNIDTYDPVRIATHEWRDIVRDVAMRLNAEERVLAYVVETENFESIHNHSAYALIEKDKERG